MDLLADENVETEWVGALRDDGHDVVRVVDVEELGTSATDPNVLAVAARRNRVLLTADQSDFSDPPSDDHAGIVIVADVTRAGGEIRRAVHRIERDVPTSLGTWRTSVTGSETCRSRSPVGPRFR